MPVVLAVPAAYWAAGALGLGAAGTVWWMSPAGEPARKATARALTNAVSRSDTRTCHECNETCPVCGLGPNPTPGHTPDYVTQNRKPLDRETILAGHARATGVDPVQGAAVYRDPATGGYIHRDNFHVGRAAHLETYDRRGNPTGTRCPHCGRTISSTPPPGHRPLRL
jgi:hypothetical protein